MFFAVLLVLGCAGLVWLLSTLVVPEWRVNHEFVATTCKVLDKRIGEKPGEDGPLYRPEIKIEYEVGGEHLRSLRRPVGLFQRAGHRAGRPRPLRALRSRRRTIRYPCWYDPRDPRTVVLVREYRWWIWLVFTVPAILYVIGAGGLIYTLFSRGKSAERRCRDDLRAQSGSPCRRRRPTRLSLRPPGRRHDQQPGHPAEVPPADGQFARLGPVRHVGVLRALERRDGSVLAICIGSHLIGRPSYWFLSMFSVLCIGSEWRPSFVFIRQLLIAAGIGPTLVEISDHPFHPDGISPVPLAIGTAGGQRLASVAGLRRNGHLPPGHEHPHRKPDRSIARSCFRREAFQIESGIPFETEFDLHVPVGAMHSFKAGPQRNQLGAAVEGDLQLAQL